VDSDFDVRALLVVRSYIDNEPMEHSGRDIIKLLAGRCGASFLAEETAARVTHLNAVAEGARTMIRINYKILC